jgi:hypothetical protein
MLPRPRERLVMQMLRYRPAAPLSAFIDQFWHARGCDPDRKRQSIEHEIFRLRAATCTLSACIFVPAAVRRCSA